MVPPGASGPARRALIDLLRGQPRTFNDLAAHFDMRLPSVSEHLRTLCEAGLVNVDKRGRERLDRLSAGPLEEVADWLGPYEAFWRDRLRGLREHLDASEQPRATTGWLSRPRVPAAPPERVWAALTDPEQLAAWFMPNDFRAEVGHRFTFDTGHWAPRTARSSTSICRGACATRCATASSAPR